MSVRRRRFTYKDVLTVHIGISLFLQHYFSISTTTAPRLILIAPKKNRELVCSSRKKLKCVDPLFKRLISLQLHLNFLSHTLITLKEINAR